MLFIGGAVGGLIGLFPFLAAHPSHVARREYIAGVIIAFVLGFLCAVARATRDEQKIDSVHSVFEMVDDIVKSYEASLTATKASSTTQAAIPKPNGSS
jgi:hypothetical protein